MTSFSSGRLKADLLALSRTFPAPDAGPPVQKARKAVDAESRQMLDPAGVLRRRQTVLILSIVSSHEALRSIMPRLRPGLRGGE